MDPSLNEDKVLRCAFCGHPYPDGTPTHKHELLTAHIRVCPEHPIGKENRELRAELDRIKHGIKTGEVTMIVDGNDMMDWCWTTHEDMNKRIALAMKLM